jgi:hypothetical protein
MFKYLTAIILFVVVAVGNASWVDDPITIKQAEIIKNKGSQAVFQVAEKPFFTKYNISAQLFQKYIPSRHSISRESAFTSIIRYKKRHIYILIGILIIIIAGFSSRFTSRCLEINKWVECNHKKIILGIAICFVILVTMGWTGSSWRILADSPAGLSFLKIEGGHRQLMGAPQEYRGDEWGVITPNALAQLNHTPPFPIVNTNIGLEGQNMGVIGMFGVPVKQWAALARPATWGYFLLPLKQAMSWQWQVQFWGCLSVLWWFLNTLRSNQSGRNLALAFSFCMAPYAAAWSNWPLYASIFPLLAFCLFATLLRTHRRWFAAALGIGLGWAIASWVLVLYPPWLVIVGSLCAALMVGWIIDNRSKLAWGVEQWLGIFLMLLVAGLLLGSWWHDTREAAAQLSATLYPGRRQTEQGGAASLFWSLRGYIGLEVIPHKLGPTVNKPEASSYFFVPLAIFLVTLLGCFQFRRDRIWGTWCALTVFIALYWWYSFIGFPVFLAEITKWGVMTTDRMDVGLGLAFVVMVALLDASGTGAWFGMSRMAQWVIGGCLAVASAGLAWWVLAHMPQDLLPSNTIIYHIAIALICAAIAWWLWQRQAQPVTLALVVLGFASAFSFNPISRAPKAVTLSDQTRSFVISDKSYSTYARTLVVDNNTLSAMALVAGNIPVVNGVLYYPHRSLWEAMKLPSDQWPVVNRYQHLTFEPDAEQTYGQPYRVITPNLDRVIVYINPKIFDYAATGAERVVTSQYNAKTVQNNPQLQRMGESGYYVWFRVLSAR